MNKIQKIFGIMIILLAALIIKVNAATATLTVDKTSATVGDTITATVKYTAAAWDLKLTADTGLTTSSTTHYADSSESADNVTKTFKVIYKATKAGTFNIKLSGNVTDESKSVADAASGTKSITVKEVTNNAGNSDSTTTTKKSSNAYLKTLGVTPKKYDFSGFKKTKTDYKITVPSDVNSVTVKAIAEDKNASVKISGNTGFDVGSNNNIKVVVTAEDGSTKTYNIKVTKLATEEESPGNIIEETEKEEKKSSELFLESLEIEGLTLLPEFNKEEYSYTAVLSDLNVTTLNVNAKANNEKAKIEITGNTELVEGENIINIIVTLDGTSEQKVYQIKVNKESSPSAIVGTQNDEGIVNNVINNVKKYAIIAIAVLAIIIIGIIVLIILLKRENKRLTNDEDNNKKNEYDVYKDKQDESGENNKTDKGKHF